MPRKEIRLTNVPDECLGSVMDRNLSSIFSPRRLRSFLSFMSRLLGLCSSSSQSSMLLGCIFSIGSMGNLWLMPFTGFNGKIVAAWSSRVADTSNKDNVCMAFAHSNELLLSAWFSFIAYFCCVYWVREPSELFHKTLRTNNIWRDVRRKNDWPAFSHYTSPPVNTSRYWPRVKYNSWHWSQAVLHRFFALKIRDLDFRKWKWD